MVISPGKAFEVFWLQKELLSSCGQEHRGKVLTCDSFMKRGIPMVEMVLHV